MRLHNRLDKNIADLMAHVDQSKHDFFDFKITCIVSVAMKEKRVLETFSCASIFALQRVHGYEKRVQPSSSCCPRT